MRGNFCLEAVIPRRIVLQFFAKLFSIGITPNPLNTYLYRMKQADNTKGKVAKEAGPASLKDIKSELAMLSPSRLLELCLHLAKYKKENKELLTYLLFESDDEHAFVKKVKEVVDEQFTELNKSNIYLAKKTLRKALRTTNKYIKYSGKKETEIELLIHFCKKIKAEGLPLHKNKALSNLYQRQILRIQKAMESLHEDLQFDYSVEIKPLL